MTNKKMLLAFLILVPTLIGIQWVIDHKGSVKQDITSSIDKYSAKNQNTPHETKKNTEKSFFSKEKNLKDTITRNLKENPIKSGVFISCLMVVFFVVFAYSYFKNI